MIFSRTHFGHCHARPLVYSPTCGAKLWLIMYLCQFLTLHYVCVQVCVRGGLRGLGMTCKTFLGEPTSVSWRGNPPPDQQAFNDLAGFLLGRV